MRLHHVVRALATVALPLAVAMGPGIGCSDFPPITTDPAFVSSPGSPGRGIGGPGLGNSGAAPSNPSLNQPGGIGTQNPSADPLPGGAGTGGGTGLPGTGGGGGSSGAPGTPGANGTFGASPSGTSHTTNAEIDLAQGDETDETDAVASDDVDAATDSSHPSEPRELAPNATEASDGLALP